uniref:Isopenicillin N synthase n=1 Tax=Candidatus Kentrum sp. LFY TaxID=2126342 RepID=A0A450UKB5_9GAMM|nr:MAG: hypothetical protein BECKLFY1418A_GA0070994_102723 [Candidatus Kentron sp. LFY]
MSKQKTNRNTVGNVKPTPERIDFNRLISTETKEDLYESVEKAFGLDGLGGIVVTNIPGFKEAKEKVQRNTYRLSKEPKEVLQSITKKDASGLHEIGWSETGTNSPFGKSSTRFVTFNQAFHSGSPCEPIVFEDPRLGGEREAVWPATIPQFKEDLIKLNTLFMPAFLGFLKYFDKHLLHNVDKGKQGKFVDSFFEHHSFDNRLLVYSPLDELGPNAEDKDIWEHWHLDQCLITTIAHPIYFTKQGEIVELDNTALAIKDRHGREHQVVFSQDEFIAISGCSMFIESAGYIPGTPHVVRISEEIPNDLYRVQSVLFLEPDFNYRMNIPTGESLEEIIERDPCRYEYRETDFFRQDCYYKEFLDEVRKNNAGM